MASLNLAVRFVLELTALGILAWWGAETGGIALALAAPAVGALIWSAFVSPKARFAVGPVVRAAVEATVFGAAALALVDLGHPILAAAFAAIALVSGVGERTLDPPDWAA